MPNVSNTFGAINQLFVAALNPFAWVGITDLLVFEESEGSDRGPILGNVKAIAVCGCSPCTLLQVIALTLFEVKAFRGLAGEITARAPLADRKWLILCDFLLIS